MASQDWFDLGVRVPITELHVAAGNTYLVRVSLSWGPKVRVLPVIPGSSDEEMLLAALPNVRAAEVEPSAEEHRTALEAEALEAIYDMCRDSSGHPDTWLRMLPGESRPSSPAPPPL